MVSGNADRPTRVGLLGYGRIVERVHLNALARVRTADIVAVAEADEARRAAAAARLPDARTFTDYRTLLEEADVDAVLVALPPALHADAASRALDAGRHVYVEKPLATTLHDARDVVHRWSGSERVGVMGFNYRYDDTYIRLGALLRDGEYGRVLAVRSVFSSAARSLPDWKKGIETGGGALLDLASHHADLIPWLLGRRVESVSARVTSQRSEADTALVNWELVGGVPVQSMCSLSTGDADRVEVYLEGGVVVADRYRGLLDARGPEHRYGRGARLRAEGEKAFRAFRSAAGRPGEPSFARCLAAFVSASRGGRDAPPDLSDGLRSLAVVEAARRSAEAGGDPHRPEETR